MISNFIIVLWLFLITIVIALSITRTRLIYVLRENYSALYVNVGCPVGFSRSISFLWRLQPYRNQLSSKDLKLLRLNLALVYASVVTTLLFVICLFI